jgi:hypothetical protein
MLGGTVLDPQQRAVPGATVEIRALSTHWVRRVSSDEQGLFLLAGLPPGDYQLSVGASGFAPVTHTLRLEVGQQQTLDVKLKLAGISNVEVEVQALEVLRATDAGVGEVIEPAAIGNLPLNGRMLIDLVLTVPGAHASHGAQAGDMNPLYWRPGQRSAVSIGRDSDFYPALFKQALKKLSRLWPS